MKNLYVEGAEDAAKLLLLGLAIGGGAWLYKKYIAKPAPPADEKQARADAEADAARVDNKQVKEEAHADAEAKAQAQAEEDARVAAAKARTDALLVAQGGKPIPEVIKRDDGTLGYYRGGRWIAVTPGAHIIGPNGVEGSFDADGRFVPSAPDAG